MMLKLYFHIMDLASPFTWIFFMFGETTVFTSATLAHLLNTYLCDL